MCPITVISQLEVPITDNLSYEDTSCPLCLASTGHRAASLPPLTRLSWSQVLARILLLPRYYRFMPQPGAARLYHTQGTGEKITEFRGEHTLWH